MSATVFNLLLAVFLLAANGFYVAAEFALVKSRGFRIDAMAEEGLFGARLSQQILGNIEAKFFTPDQLRMIVDFVSERGGGFT